MAIVGKIIWVLVGCDFPGFLFMECLSAGRPGNDFGLNQHWEAGKETYARKYPPNLMKISWHVLLLILFLAGM